jgi:hypothetical protein
MSEICIIDNKCFLVARKMEEVKWERWQRVNTIPLGINTGFQEIFLDMFFPSVFYSPKQLNVKCSFPRAIPNADSFVR